MNYKEAIAYVNQIPWTKCKPGLHRIGKLLDMLGNPQNKLKFIHIAGTNGKGSTAAIIASIMQASGYRTGLFTSPHLSKYNERIQINRMQISDEAFTLAVQDIKKCTDVMSEHPTEFEILTALGFVYFEKNKCDIVVLEVGMGGGLDSTNIINSSEVSVITAIGFDHMAQLGATLTQITGAKCGIIKEKSDVIAYGGDNEVEKVIREKCDEMHSSLYFTDFNRINIINFNTEQQIFRFRGLNSELKLNLIGTYQLRNAAVALTTVEILKNKGYRITEESIKKGLLAARWPSRFEVLHHNPLFIVDGAHNSHGIAAVAESLKNQFTNIKITFLVGILSDKDSDDMINILIPYAKEFITITPNSNRALDGKELADKIQKKGTKAAFFNSIEDGIEEAIRKAGERGVICSLGSLYLAGDIRAYMLKR